MTWPRLTLAGRMAWVMVLLLLIVQFAGFWAVRSGVQAQASTEIEANLQVGERLFRRLLEQHQSRLRDAAVVLATDFGFRSAIGSGDVETIASALENSAARIGASVAIFVDANGHAISANAGQAADIDRAVRQLPANLAHGDGSLMLLDGVPYQFVAAPVRAPVLVGRVFMGFPLGQGLIDDFYQLSAIHAAVLAAPPGAPLRLVVSSLGPAASAVQDAAAAQQSQAQLHDVTFELRRWTLPADGGELQVVLARSVNEVMAPFHALERLLGLITLGGVVLFAIGSRLAAGRVARPLARLTHSTAEIEAGRFDARIDGTQRHDEVGSLARGFDRMRRSLATQRDEILRLAYWDSLTGLPNRAQFLRWLRETVEAPAQPAVPATILVLNLNRFKHVNDVLGYAVGDRLLQAVAARLRGLCRPDGDRVARLGGDRFALLLQPADTDHALEVAQRLHVALAQPLDLDEQAVDVSASVGVASWPRHAPSAELWLSRAEMAMQAAKNQVAETRLYAPELDSASAQSVSLLTELRRAVEHNELRLYLQPKIRAHDGHVMGAEALVRWQHPQRGLVPPFQFIPFAEQTGFIRQLTLWVFHEVAQHGAHLQRLAPGFRIAMNLSTRDLMDSRLPDKLHALLQQHHVSAAGFTLEITESAIMDDPQRAEATVHALASLGFSLAIDDFGTGYSSLAYLKRLPVHELKIDQSFVKGMLDDASDAKIVRSTIDLAHNLGLQVVAEGVETPALLEALRQQGCDLAQGYGIARPMPVADLPAWLAGWQPDQSAPSQASS